MKYESDSDTNYSWCTWNSPQELGKKRLKELEIRDRIETIQTKIGKNTQKSPWGPEETYCYSDLSERPKLKTGVENLQVVK